MIFFHAFWVGGLICVIVQLLMEKTKLMPGRIMVMLVLSGVLVSFLGLFEKLKDFAGAGVTVPLFGYGHILMDGVKQAVDEKGALGIFTGGFSAGSAGVCAALVFALLAALVFEPKMKS